MPSLSASCPETHINKYTDSSKRREFKIEISIYIYIPSLMAELF